MTQQEIIDKLKQQAPEGALLGVIVRNTLAKNTKRIMSFIIFTVKDGEVKHEEIDGLVANLYAYKRVDTGVVIEGYGMDMGLKMAYQLGKSLYGRDDAFRYVAL